MAHRCAILSLRWVMRRAGRRYQALASAAGSIHGKKSPRISDEASARFNAGSAKKAFPSIASLTKNAAAIKILNIELLNFITSISQVSPVVRIVKLYRDLCPTA